MMRPVKVRGGGMSRQNGKGEVNMTNLLANLLSPIYSPMGVSTADFISYLGSAPQPRQDKQQKHKAKQSESGPQG